jgi:3-oxoadipate enol-lactonase
VTDTHVEIRGPEDAPPVLCLHGGTGTGEYHWGRIGKALAESYRVHLPDLPGHGRTPLPEDARYDRDLLAACVRALVEAVGTPAHVLAFSMGGHATLALAQGRPELFASLVLIGVSVRDHTGLQAWRANFDPDELEATYPLWARTLARIHEPLGGPDAWKDVCRRDAGGLEVAVDVDALGSLAWPVLLVRGDRDSAVDPGHYAELRAVWGERAEELVIPNGGHDVQMTRQGLMEPALADFLGRVVK